jgi:hypothetical protein
LTLSQYREIKPQLDEMLNQHIEHPSIPKDVPHRSYLVTNGRIEEEVTLAISQGNATNARDGYPKRELKTIAREQLLGWAIELESSLWPSELSELRTLLEILTHKGDELFPVEKFHKLLAALLKLDPSDSDHIGEPEFRRRLSSAALLTAVAVKPFCEKANNWAVASAWVTFSVYAIACASKYRRSDKVVSQSLDMAAEAIWHSLSELLAEAHKRDGRYWEGNGLADFAVYGWRYTLLMGIGSIFWLECERAGCWQEGEVRSKIQSILPVTQDKMGLWGEGAIPQFIFHEWYLRNCELDSAGDSIIGLARRIVAMPLFCVYYSAKEVIRHQLSETLEAFTSKISQTLGEEPRVSYFTEAMMVHLAQSDLKEACRKSVGAIFKDDFLGLHSEGTVDVLPLALRGRGQSLLCAA